MSAMASVSSHVLGSLPLFTKFLTASYLVYSLSVIAPLVGEFSVSVSVDQCSFLAVPPSSSCCSRMRNLSVAGCI